MSQTRGRHSGILTLLRLALGGLYVFAGVIKLQGPLDFSTSVMAFKILPDHLAQLATFAIPWTEVICGVALLAGWWARASALVLAVLTGIFIAGIASVLERGLSVNCGCFGKLSPFCKGPLGSCNLVQNAIILIAAFVVCIGGPGRLAIDNALVRSGDGPGPRR